MAGFGVRRGTMAEVIKTSEEKYPSVDLAYTLALASYDLIQKRLDIIDTRLQTLIALIATVSLPIPAIAVAKNLTLNSSANGWIARASLKRVQSC
jgi:hypothetical protein